MYNSECICRYTKIGMPYPRIMSKLGASPDLLPHLVLERKPGECP